MKWLCQASEFIQLWVPLSGFLHAFPSPPGTSQWPRAGAPSALSPSYDGGLHGLVSAPSLLPRYQVPVNPITTELEYGALPGEKSTQCAAGAASGEAIG